MRVRAILRAHCGARHRDADVIVHSRDEPAVGRKRQAASPLLFAPLDEHHTLATDAVILAEPDGPGRRMPAFA
jgi:hypothetical protein